MTESIKPSSDLSLGQKTDLCIAALPAQFRYIVLPDDGDPMDGLLQGIRELCVSFSEGNAKIEHLNGALGNCHKERKAARADRRDAMDILQRASIYAHGAPWPQELFDAIEAVLTRYANGLPLLEGPK